MLKTSNQFTNIVISSHIAHTSPTSSTHVGEFLLASASHVGGIHMNEKTRCVRCKPKFLCRLCKGDHLTCLCPATAVVQEAWSFPGGPSGFELSLSSQPSLVDTIVMPMQYSADTPIPLRVDASLDLVVSHPIQETA
jgi:hypothetical protein